MSQDPHPRWATHSERGHHNLDSSLRSEGFEPHVGTPAQGTCTGKINPHNGLRKPNMDQLKAYIKHAMSAMFIGYA